MTQQVLGLNVDTTFLARVFAMHLQPFFGTPVDEVQLREMRAALETANIDPILAHSFIVSQNDECMKDEFEVAVAYTEGTSNQHCLIYITENDMALGQVTDMEMFAIAIDAHGKQLASLMDRARSCAADPRCVAIAHTHLQDAFSRLRDSLKPSNPDGY
ncbi:hypothetical protein D3C85_372860 [compost metagenome]